MNNINDVKTPQDLYLYMQSNISYGYLDKKGKIHLPSDKDFNDVWFDNYILEDYDDLLKTKIGNCWDQTEFERIWFFKNGYKIKTYYEMVMLDYVNPYPTHSFLTYNKDGKWYWFENSDFNNRGIHEFESEDKLLKYQLSTYIKFLKEFQIKEEELKNVKLFLYDKPSKNIPASEYINHVTKNEIINLKGKLK